MGRESVAQRSRTTAGRYAELHAHSSFSFLDGASSPEELVEQAAQLGLSGLALTDHDSFSGVVRFATAAREAGVPTIFGAELNVDVPLPRTKSAQAIAARAGVPDPPGHHLLVLARDPTGYASLSRVISRAQLRGGVKGRPQYDWDELTEAAGGHWLVLTGCRKGPVRAALEAGPLGSFALEPARAALDELVGRFGREHVAVELTYARDPLADERTAALAQLADQAGLEAVATTGAHYHAPERSRLADVMAAIRARSSLDELAGYLPGWAGGYLRGWEEMAHRFAPWPGVVDTAAELGEELAFDLQLIAPRLPPFPVPAGHGDEMAYLRELTYAGAQRRYGPRGPDTEKAYGVIEHELSIIEQLGYPGYFLVVWELVTYCRAEGILCQGRGSAANSAVCYALGVTAVDAVKHGLLFERFLSPERDGPPDIDVDIESDLRELVIQHVYETHGRDYAAQVANVITYRPRSAIRDVAKALGYSPGQQDAWSRQVERHYWTAPEQQALVGNDTAVGDDVPELVLELAGELQDTPRHLGIHSGGMVICDRPIIEVCPVEWGRMPGRSVLQWDKEDCANAGLTKFDLLGLGMLSALRYTFELVETWHGKQLSLYDIPTDDPLVYDMLCRADTIGVFQIESRAQQSTLPRLKPRSFYDLAIEIALIRPGPIQGDSVHPYLRRRDGEEPVTYPHPDLEPILAKTLGVPLFQEQLMQLAVVAAGFTPGEADTLRRAMGAKRSVQRMEALRHRLYDGMQAKGITGPAADDIWEKIKSFASFGFPESHSISFAFLAIASSWLKLYYPAAFLAALLNAQPMGFYNPQTLVHDARRHGIQVLGVDIAASMADASLEPTTTRTYTGPGPHQPAVRLGLSSVRTISNDLAETISDDRAAHGLYRDMPDLARRIGLTTPQLEALATAGAFHTFGLSRRDALWQAGPAAANHRGQLAITPDVGQPALPIMTTPEEMAADLWATGISRVYPTQLLRDQLDQRGVIPAAGLSSLEDKTRVTVAGIVTHRQRPSSAGGVTFLNLEDETGLINIICPVPVWTRHRQAARDSPTLTIRGTLERTHNLTNILAEHIQRLPLTMRATSRDFR